MDCNGYPNNGIRYDSPTWYGFSVSGGYAEDDTVDVAIRYAADWNNFKVSAAYGFSETTDEGCSTPGTPGVPGTCFSLTVLGGGGAPFQGARRDATVNQAGASILHVPTGLFIYGMYQREENNGTSLTFELPGFGAVNNMNETDVWYIKAGIKRTWTPLGATVLFGEAGQYEHQFNTFTGIGGGSPVGPTDLCAGTLNPSENGGACLTNTSLFMTDSKVDRWGAGIVQEIDAAAMHVWFNWQHLEFEGDFAGNGTVASNPSGGFSKVNQGFDNLDMFMAGGVIFF
jgi:predicted porin